MTASPSDTAATPPLTESARAVLRLISRSGPMTRPQLGAALAFSKPTMSAAVGELEEIGLAESNGIAQGALGRRAVTYGLGPRAGFTIGVDCGTTQIHAMAATLDGRCFAELQETIAEDDQRRFKAIETTVAALLKRHAGKRKPLRAIAIALPNIISQSLDRLPARAGFLKVLQRLRDAYDVPILLENNVNCAALAEYHEGAAKNHAFAVYMQIGVKVGLGIVIEGRLFRGFRGGAGEIGHLPFPWSEKEQPRFQQVETYLGSAQLLERCRKDWPAADGKPPRSTEELFARAKSALHARRCIDRHATDIGNLAAACVSLLDPEIVVLGGGVGQNGVLLEGVRKVVTALCWPVEIVNGELPNRATVLGTVRLATDFALARLLGEDSSAAFLYPGALTADRIRA